MRTILVSVVGVAAVAAAASPALASAGRPAARSPLAVVAAENVYGDIVRQIGGAHVAVTSILTDPNADPHLFEPATRTGLAVAEARLVVENGLGYDAFADRLVRATPSGERVVVTIADALGVHGADANPHLWYDVPRLGRIAAAIAGGLERADQAHARAYRAGLARFVARLAPLRREVAHVRRRFAGRAVAYTEPVPGYLVAAAGLRNLAPASFTRAVEDGTEPSPRAVSAMQALVTSRRIGVLLYNSQAVTPLTQRLRDEASKAGIPVVAVTETLPPGVTFQRWQLAQATALDAALSG